MRVEDSVIAWEGRTQADIAVMIDRYLAEHPCPGDSRHPDEWRQWASDLREAGNDRLIFVGARQFRSVT